MHEVNSVIISAVCGSETRHGNTNYTMAVETKHIERFDGNKQCKSGVQTSRDTNYCSLSTNMMETFGKTFCLNGNNFTTALIEVLVGSRHKGMWVNGTGEIKFMGRNECGFDDTIRRSSFFGGASSKCGVCTAIGTESLYVNLSDKQLWTHCVIFSFGHELAVLKYHRFAAEDDILCAFAKARSSIYISTDATCTLLTQ